MQLEGLYWFCQNHMRLNTGLAESVKVKVTQSCPTLCNTLDHDSAWNSLGQNPGEAFPFSKASSQLRNQSQVSPAEPQGKPKNTGMGSLSVLQQIFPTQESNWVLLYSRQILYQVIREAQGSL